MSEADKVYDMGWVRDPDAVQRVLDSVPMPYFSTAAPHLEGDGRGKTILLYDAWTKLLGRWPNYPAQEIGCCVGRGFAAGTDLLQAIEQIVKGDPEEYKETSHEYIYATSRVDVGGQRGSYQDGSVGAWASKAVVQHGVVPREIVGAYSDKRARDWGAKGAPAEVKAEGLKHKIGTSSLVTTYEELEDSLYNGYPVVVCSDQGFTLTRDAEGFCQPKGTWMHCMLVIGVRAGDRPGACILQSWGDLVPGGPLVLNQPSCSFWSDKKVISRMLAQKDSWSLSNFDGYPSRGDAISKALFLMI